MEHRDIGHSRGRVVFMHVCDTRESEGRLMDRPLEQAATSATIFIHEGADRAPPLAHSSARMSAYTLSTIKSSHDTRYTHLRACVRACVIP